MTTITVPREIATVAGVAGIALGTYALWKYKQFIGSDCDMVLASKTLPPNAFRDKVVWITGASSGIGECLAYAFGKQGAKLILSSRTQEDLERVRKALLAAGSAPDCVKILVCDLSDLDGLPSKVKEAISFFGAVDVCVNNGGCTMRCLWHEADWEKVDMKINTVNFLAPVLLTKVLLPSMVERGTGSIVNVSSVAGKGGFARRTAYCGSKFGLIGYMDALRVELQGTGVSITNACPGPVKTAVARNALLGDGSRFNGADPLIDNGLCPQRCADLILTGTAHKLSELWISQPKFMRIFYNAQYFPDKLRAKLGNVAGVVGGKKKQ